MEEGTLLDTHLPWGLTLLTLQKAFHVGFAKGRIYFGFFDLLCGGATLASLVVAHGHTEMLRGARQRHHPLVDPVHRPFLVVPNRARLPQVRAQAVRVRNLKVKSRPDKR